MSGCDIFVFQLKRYKKHLFVSLDCFLTKTRFRALEIQNIDFDPILVIKVQYFFTEKLHYFKMNNNQRFYTICMYCSHFVLYVKPKYFQSLEASQSLKIQEEILLSHCRCWI